MIASGMIRRCIQETLRKLEVERAPYTGPVECWQHVIDAMTTEEAAAWLLTMLRSRRRMFSVNHNGRAWPVTRAALRDYLRERPRPLWLRSRPAPAGKGDTIRFRSSVPFKAPA